MTTPNPAQYRVIKWDWRSQPDIQEINNALIDLPGALLHPVDTGDDSFVVVVGDMANSEAQACFEQWRRL